VVLLGDAAHPMLPSMAQGAVQSLEDAIIWHARLARQRGLILRPPAPGTMPSALPHQPGPTRVSPKSTAVSQIKPIGAADGLCPDLAGRTAGPRHWCKAQ